MPNRFRVNFRLKPDFLRKQAERAVSLFAETWTEDRKKALSALFSAIEAELAPRNALQRALLAFAFDLAEDLALDYLDSAYAKSKAKKASKSKTKTTKKEGAE